MADKGAEIDKLARDLDEARIESAGKFQEIADRLGLLRGSWSLSISRDDGSTIGAWTVPADQPFEWEGEGLRVVLTQ